MTMAFQRATCRVLVASLFSLSFHGAHAGLIGADQAQAGTPNPDRVLVLGALDRAEVIAQLQTAGVACASACTSWSLMAFTRSRAASGSPTAPAPSCCVPA
jgi:hypothetical protein